MSYDELKSRRQKRKEEIIDVMGGQCAICGYHKCNSALELHHINPEEKEFTFSQNILKRWEDMQQELQKSILLCANCHREVHEKDIENLKSTFNVEKALVISKRINAMKKHDTKHCLKCGTIVGKDSDYCPTCANELRRKCERPERDVLKQLIYHNTFVSIGKFYGVSDNTIRKWCQSYNLPSRKTEINKYSLKEWNKI